MPDVHLEKALRAYCSPSLVKEYQASTKNQKEKILEALLISQQSHLVRVMQAKQAQGIDMATLPKADETCPLVIALKKKGIPPIYLLKEALDECQSVLSYWASESPSSTSSSVKLANYAAVCRQQKSLPTYHEPAKDQFHSMTTNTDIAKSGGPSRKSWADMKKMNIQDLHLFETSWGSYLEGTIVGEAIQPYVGGTTMIQDPTGDVLMICFYNFLAGGVRGAEAEPILKAKFPKGATMKIAEPFLKIFGDGSRGIRVDNPSDIKIVPNDGGKPTELEEEDLSKAKNRGNAFVAKKNHDAALDVFLTTLRSTSLVPTLLSNRAQASIQLEQWSSGLFDAAASLTIRPSCKKTWIRYNVCLEKVSQCKEQNDNISQIESTRSILNLVFDSIPESLSQNNQTSSARSGLECKTAGNEAFKAKDFGRAIAEYSMGLTRAGVTVQTILNNSALCSLKIGALHDCIAFAAASSRISTSVKATYRLSKALALLSEHDLARKCLNLQMDDPDLKQLEKEVWQAGDFLHPGASALGVLGLREFPPLLCNWIGPVETFYSEGKGRGLRATQKLLDGDMILVEAPIISSKFDVKEDNVHVVAVSSKGQSVEKSSKFRLKETLVNRAQHDGVLSKILGQLSSGDRGDPLVPASAMMRSLASCRPLLLGHREYLIDKDALPTLTTEQIGSIVDINVHGKGAEEDCDSTNLFPCVSMINHSSDPNAGFTGAKRGPRIIMALKDIAQGEEIFMLYHTDKQVLETKWGIEE